MNDQMMPESISSVASRDDPVSWRFVPGYWMGRLGRLTVFVRLTSEPEARFLAEGGPHSGAKLLVDVGDSVKLIVSIS